MISCKNRRNGVQCFMHLCRPLDSRTESHHPWHEVSTTRLKLLLVFARLHYVSEIYYWTAHLSSSVATFPSCDSSVLRLSAPLVREILHAGSSISAIAPSLSSQKTISFKGFPA